jgi:magnesium chelatase family protein
MNLCPCGGRGDAAAGCACSAPRLASFRQKLSRALLDRFDLVLAMPRLRGTELSSGTPEGSGTVSERVAEGRSRLEDGGPSFAQAATALLDRAVDSLGLSGRGRARVGRVAATIAALAASAETAPEHVAEALSYRAPAELTAP